MASVSNAATRDVSLVLSDMSGGMATAYPPHAINDTQVSDSLNVVFEKHGCSRAPGLAGITTSPLFDGACRGWFCYKPMDGSRYYLAVYSGKLYNVDPVAKTKTLLYTLSSDNECFGVNYFGKFWIVNGHDAIKVESDLSVYRIGILPPTTGFSAEAGSSGSLPEGLYGIYVSYTRQINGINVLYSEPLNVGNIQLTSNTTSIRINTIKSDDPQVTHITVWMTATDGSDYYWFADGLNADGYIDILSDTKNEDIMMMEEAVSNQLPISLDTIYAHGCRLYGTVSGSNEIFYSMFAQNVYDCERWPTENHIPSVPFVAYSLFAVGSNLYVNTAGGPFVFVDGDVSTRPEPVIQGAANNMILFFPKNMRKTVQEYNNTVCGITNDGFRIFDGASFSIDLSKHIKPIIDKIIDGSGINNPYGIIFRRQGKRTEYQVSFRDKEVSNSNNRTLVLNLDTYSVIDNDNYIAAWELWGHGYSGAIVGSDGGLIVAQHNEWSGAVAKEHGVVVENAFLDTGVWSSTKTPKKFFVRTKTFIVQLAGIDQWQRIYYMGDLGQNALLRLVIPDTEHYSFPVTIEKATASNQPILNPTATLILPFVLGHDNPTSAYAKLSMKCKGNSVAVELEQTADDEKLLISRLELYGIHERNVFS